MTQLTLSSGDTYSCVMIGQMTAVRQAGLLRAGEGADQREILSAGCRKDSVGVLNVKVDSGKPADTIKPGCATWKLPPSEFQVWTAKAGG